MGLGQINLGSWESITINSITRHLQEYSMNLILKQYLVAHNTLFLSIVIFSIMKRKKLSLQLWT